MPTGTKVDEVYQALLKKGYSKEKAARIAQAETGEALATGRPPKRTVAAANANEELMQMIRPSSERVSVSPGRQVLEELRRDKVHRQTAVKPIHKLPEF